MKLLRVRAGHFKNLTDDTVIDFVAQAKKTSEDKEYELLEIAEGLYVYSIGAFVGKNASGKTTALELLDCCYDILSGFHLENKHYAYDGVSLEIIFYHEGYVYRYSTLLHADLTLGNRATFSNQHMERKKYYKSNLPSLYDDQGFKPVEVLGALPEDTAIVFFVLKKKQVSALFFGSDGFGADTYRIVFRLLKSYQISPEILFAIIRIFDHNIRDLQKIDDHNYRVDLSGHERILSDKELFHLLSSGTTKGLVLYMMAVVSLQNGFDLLVDEIEAHFHKTLVENVVSLYMDKTVNRHNATLLFSTHYCEVLDLVNRQDNVWICRADDQICIQNMFSSFNVRSGILKSKRFYNNAFQTAVNYDELMNLKRELMK